MSRLCWAISLAIFCPACRTVLPPRPPGNGPFCSRPAQAPPHGPDWLLWLLLGLALGLCAAWLYRRLRLRFGLKETRAKTGENEMKLARAALRLTEELLRTLPRKGVVFSLLHRLARKGKKPR